MTGVAAAESRTASAGSAGPAERLRVVHVITTLTTGGAERQLEWITRHTAHEPQVIALYEAGAVAEAIERAGVPVHVLGMTGGRKALAVPRLARLIRRLRPDVVHVHLLAAQLWGIPAARLAGVRTVVSTEHSLMDSSIENRPLTAPLRRLYLTLERLTTRTVAVSATTRDRLIRWGVPGGRISVIDNGIDFETLRFSPGGRDRVRSELGIGRSVAVLGAVGRLEQVKRFPQLLDAVADALRAGDLELIIAGGGPLLDDLRRQADDRGVGAAVHVLGPRADVPDVLSAMDAMISPSRDETFGMAVIEALASGLPVAYAQCPALDELDEVPSWAVALPGPGDPGGREASEAATLRAGMDQLLELGAAAGSPAQCRFPVPDALIRAYGIGSTSSALDELYTALRRRAA